MSTEHCKATVYDNHRWRRYPCDRKASTPAGYCKIHDPDCRKERAAKRPPTKRERRDAAIKRIDELLAIVETNDPECARHLRTLIFELSIL